MSETSSYTAISKIKRSNVKETRFINLPKVCLLEYRSATGALDLIHTALRLTRALKNGHVPTFFFHGNNGPCTSDNLNQLDVK